MKNVFLVLLVLGFSANSFAGSLVGCRLYVDGKAVEEVKPFDIHKYASKHPEATVDGGLLDFTVDETTVKMSFSNECDNMYEITFSKAAIAKAVSGQYKTLIGKASIGTADLEKPFVGLLKCGVRN